MSTARIYDVTLENDRQIDEVGQPPKNDDRNEQVQDREILFFSVVSVLGCPRKLVNGL